MEPPEAKFDVKVVKNVLITARDGVKLACCQTAPTNTLTYWRTK